MLTPSVVLRVAQHRSTFSSRTLKGNVKPLYRCYITLGHFRHFLGNDFGLLLLCHHDLESVKV